MALFRFRSIGAVHRGLWHTQDGRNNEHTQTHEKQNPHKDKRYETRPHVHINYHNTHYIWSNFQGVLFRLFEIFEERKRRNERKKLALCLLSAKVNCSFILFVFIVIKNRLWTHMHPIHLPWVQYIFTLVRIVLNFIQFIVMWVCSTFRPFRLQRRQNNAMFKCVTSWHLANICDFIWWASEFHFRNVNSNKTTPNNTINMV